MRFLFAAFLAVALQPARQAGVGSIEGTVTVSGTGALISGATVRLYRMSGGLAPGPTAVTDSSGHFVIPGVPADQYSINITSDRYARPESGFGLDRLTIKDGQVVKGVALQMALGAVIEGRIVGARGQPEPDIRIDAWKVFGGVPEMTVSFKTASSNDRGEFRLFGLDPGKYVISAQYAPQRGAAQGAMSSTKTYFPGTLDLTRAASLDVSSGAVVDGTNFVLQTAVGARISGRVFTGVSSSGGTVSSTLYLVPKRGLLVGTTNSGAGLSGQSDPRTGYRDFEIDGVPAGSYNLFAVARDESQRLNAGRVEVEVISQDVAGLTVTIGRSQDVAVKIEGPTEGPRLPMESLTALLIPEAPMPLPLQFSAGRVSRNTPPPLHPDTDGNFMIPAVSPGNYTVSLQGLPPDMAVTEVKQGAATVFSGKVTIGSQSPEPLRIFVSRAGTLEGTVRDRVGKPINGQNITLVPDSAHRADYGFIKWAVTDPDGYFLLRGIAPGEYTLLVTTKGLTVNYQNPEEFARVEPLARKVTVAPGARLHIDTTPIAAEDLAK